MHLILNSPINWLYREVYLGYISALSRKKHGNMGGGCAEGMEGKARNVGNLGTNNTIHSLDFIIKVLQ